MKTIKPLLILVCMGLFVTMSYSQTPIIQKLFAKIDAKFYEELSDVDFSQDELKRFKDFIHHGIETSSSKELAKNFDMIIKNAQTLIEQFEDESTNCKVSQESLGDQNYIQINQDCFKSTLKKICPLYPFC